MQTVLTRGYAPHTIRNRNIFARIRLWLDLWAERRSLAALDQRMLADLGLTEYTAQREAARPMWDVPSNREHHGGFELFR